MNASGVVRPFLKEGCSGSLTQVLDRAFGHPLLAEEHATQPFMGGIMQHGYQCGMVWGATLAAGAQAYRQFGPGPEAEARAIVAAGRLVDIFRAANKGHVDCVDITDIDRSSSVLKMVVYFLFKGGTVGCIRRGARYAPAALEAIRAAFSEAAVIAPAAPVSCAALLARRMGVPEMRAIMTAGFAGGIGLGGGACGALGAAIWILALQEAGEDGTGRVAFKSPRAQGLVERLMACTDYELECSKIVGRRFENVDDHASHLRSGGCSRLIEALSAG